MLDGQLHCTNNKSHRRALNNKKKNNPRLPFREEILKMDHLDHDSHVLLRSRAQVVFHVTLSLKLEHHLFDGGTFPTDTAEFVPQTMGHTLQSILDEGFPLDETLRKFRRALEVIRTLNVTYY